MQGIQDDSDEVGSYHRSGLGWRSAVPVFRWHQESSAEAEAKGQDESTADCENARKMALQRTPSFQENLDQMIFAQTAIEDLNLRVYSSGSIDNCILYIYSINIYVYIYSFRHVHYQNNGQGSS